MTVRYQLAIRELQYLSQQDDHEVAAVADTVLAVYDQWCTGGLDLEDFQSIVLRNLKELNRLAVSRERDLAQRALEDLI